MLYVSRKIASVEVPGHNRTLRVQESGTPLSKVSFVPGCRTPESIYGSVAWFVDKTGMLAPSPQHGNIHLQ